MAHVLFTAALLAVASGVRVKHLLLFVTVGCGILSSQALAQQPADIIRGQVTGPDSLPIANARVTATSYSGSVSKNAETDRAGRFQIIFINGEGDYWIEVGKLGFTRRRFEIKRVGEEQIMLADARLTSAITTLDAVNVTAANRALVNRNSTGTDVSGGNKALDANATAVPPDQAGNLAAMAATVAGFQRIPGMDGFADMFSAFGLGGDQNNTTVNGLGSGVSALPPDAQVRVTFSQFPADVARGGFSGAQISVQSIAGSNYSARGVSGYGTGPALQFADQGATSSGQKSTALRIGGSLRGPIRLDKSFYNASWAAQRTFADNLTLLNASPPGLLSAGVSTDSAKRLLAILGGKGVSVSLDRNPRLRAIDNFTYQANIDLSPSSSGAGHSFILGVVGGYAQMQPTGGSVSMLTRTPTQAGHAGGWSTSTSLAHSSYFWFGILSQTTVGASLRQQWSAPYLDYPAGIVRVGSQLIENTTSIKDLSFGGGTPKREASNNAIQLSNQLQWFSNDNKHTVKVTSSVAHEHNATDVDASGGTFSFNSLADLQADMPAAFMRTLSPVHASNDQVTAGVSVGDSWRPARTLQIQYGIRADANRFLYQPSFNSAVHETFGIRNDAVPNRVALSPRVGLQWTYGVAPTLGYAPGAARPPLAVINAVAGIYQNVGSANLLSNAVAQTGLPSSTRTITCVGPAAPVPRWSAYSTDVRNAPTSCIGSSVGNAFSSSAPSVYALERDFEQPRSLRTALSWSSPIFDNRLVLGLQGVYSWNMNQPGIIDINLDSTRGFILASEGSRKVFVDPSTILPSTGGIAIANSRRSAAFANVALNRSDLHSASTLLVGKVVPVTTNRYLSLDFTYSLLNVREQFYGFSGAGSTVGNPFIREWGQHTAGGRHQFVINWNSAPLVDLLYFTISTAVKSGARFTPMVAGDVNGDGLWNDRAFVFDPARATDSSLASGMRSVLDKGSAVAKKCLSAQLQQLASRATCKGPWVAATNISVRLNPQKVRLPKRANVTINITNALAIADLISHGSANLRGWGQDIQPDPNLLFVRGFAPVTKEFKYSVNEWFGSTRPRQAAARSIPFLSINVSYDIGFTAERQLLTRRLDIGRIRPGLKQSEGELKAFGTSSIPNPMAMILRQSDSLELTRHQADSIATLSTKFTQYADSVWTPVSRALSAKADHYSHSDAYRQYVVARERTMDYLIAIAPELRGLLTSGQKRKIPRVILNYMDDRVLRFLRTSSAGDGGNLFIR